MISIKATQMVLLQKVCLLLLIISCTSARHNPAPGYTLYDQAGRSYKHESFHGHYSLVYFGFSRCQSECPRALDKIINVLKLLDPKKSQGVNSYFVSIDPSHDTFESMDSSFSSAGKKIISLKGEMKDVQIMAKEFRLTFTPADGDDFPSHSDRIFLVGLSGELISVYTGDNSIQDMVNKLQELPLEN
jgi:protein SCO1/2